MRQGQIEELIRIAIAGGVLAIILLIGQVVYQLERKWGKKK